MNCCRVAKKRPPSDNPTLFVSATKMRLSNFSNARSPGLWQVVNELTRFDRTMVKIYRVTIFGSPRLKRATPVYDGLKKLAAKLTKMVAISSAVAVPV
jgi:hypothetical protein